MVELQRCFEVHNVLFGQQTSVLGHKVLFGQAVPLKSKHVVRLLLDEAIVLFRSARFL